MTAAPAETPEIPAAGVVLAGGQSRRMGGGRKALAPLGGRTLLDHVLERIEPQVRSLLLSVETPDPALKRFGRTQVPDPGAGGNGPLGGLLAALEVLPAGLEWLLLAPCDAPFLPRDLGVILLQAARERGQPGAVARYAGELQPTFSLWNRSLLPAVRQAVLQDGLGGFKSFLDRTALPVVDWTEAAVSPFFNVNTPEELQHAEALVRARLG